LRTSNEFKCLAELVDASLQADTVLSVSRSDVLVILAESISTSNRRNGDAVQFTPPSLSALLSLNPADIERCDIARMNLLCAENLPGAEQLDVDDCLSTLDAWTNVVEGYVKKCRQDYQRNPDQYDRHRGFFCFLCMVTQLKHPRGLGVRYQPTAVGNYDFSDSRDDLLHGILTRKLGTCASLPALYVSVGRRLGWPMFLTIAKRHVMCQWVDEDGTHRNLEGSCPGGGNTFSDEYYQTWPHTLTSDELASGRFLRPLNNAESLALFLETRGHCLVDNHRFAHARDAYAHARRFAPQWADYDNHICSLELHVKRARETLVGGTILFTPVLPTINAPIARPEIFPVTFCISGLTH